MELKLVTCGVALMAFMVTGIRAQPEVCGVAPRNPRIAGGKDAPAGAWPWMANLHFRRVPVCGGSLINNQWVITAAQCVLGAPVGSFDVYLGTHNQTGLNPEGVSRTVSQIVIHPKFNKRQFDNDLALMQLTQPVNFTDYIHPVCLAASGSSYKAGTECWITGWGSKSTTVPLPSPGTLQEVTVPIVSNSDCKKVYDFITDNMLCAGLPKGGQGICAGDGGGPMVRKVDSKWVQAGVIIFSSQKGCAHPGIPDGYTRVSRYESWIKSVISTNQPGFIRDGAAQLVSLSLPLLLSLVLVHSWF